GGRLPASARVRSPRGWSSGPPSADPRSPSLRFGSTPAGSTQPPGLFRESGRFLLLGRWLAAGVSPRRLAFARHAGGAPVRLRRILAHLRFASVRLPPAPLNRPGSFESPGGFFCLGAG